MCVHVFVQEYSGSAERARAAGVVGSDRGQAHTAAVDAAHRWGTCREEYTQKLVVHIFLNTVSLMNIVR